MKKIFLSLLLMSSAITFAANDSKVTKEKKNNLTANEVCFYGENVYSKGAKITESDSVLECIVDPTTVSSQVYPKDNNQSQKLKWQDTNRMKMQKTK